MRVLITNISPLRDAALYEELLRYVPAERQEKIARCGKQEDRRRSLGAGLLLEYGLRSLGCSLLPLVPGTETVHLVRGAHGKPELSGGTGVHFNLSHAGDYAAAVFDDGAGWHRRGTGAARECECYAKAVYGSGECVSAEQTGCVFKTLDAQGKLLQSGRGRTAPAAFFF